MVGRWDGVAAAALAVVMVQAMPATSTGACPDGSSPIDVPGQGPSCPVEGGWLVLLANGDAPLTHGPDHLPANDLSLLATPDAPVCVADPLTQYHNRAIYARPTDKADRYATIAPQVRGLIDQANGLLRQEGLEFGVDTEYKFRCASGVVEVVNAVLPTPAASDTFTTIMNDLKALGYGSTLAKYWVWYDDTVSSCGGCAGQGTLHDDDSPGITNQNNVGPDYAVTYGVLAANVMMHESGHNLGAVQLSAPNTSGGFHCNDGQDVMCYADGGSNSSYDPNVCPAQHFDCGHNDYFRPNPPSGSYLATHWNLGSSVNRFLQHGVPVNAPSAPQNLVGQAGPGIGQITLDWQAPADPGTEPIAAYRVYRGTASGQLTLLTELGVVLTFTDAGLGNGALRYYKVSAVNAVGEGPKSNEASARTFAAPSAPRNLVATASANQIALDWDPPVSDGGTPVTGYQLFRATPSSPMSFYRNLGTDTNFTDTDLPPGTAFSYKVRANNAVGLGAFGNVATATTPIVPSAPPSLRAVPGPGLGQVTLDWTAPASDGGSPVTAYRIYRGAGTAEGPVVAEVGNVLRYVDTVPSTGLYNYRVSAVNGVGEGPPSAQAFAAQVRV